MDKNTIDEIILYLKNGLINSGINIESIALFGSALTGKMSLDSDIDIIIVSNDFHKKDIFERARMTMKPETDTMKKFKIPMDILNMSPEEYRHTLESGFFESKIVA
jgi:predicted nucleotidyltransferase